MGASETQRTAVVIEDDPDIRDLLRTILTQSGFDAIAAADGPSGIDAVAAHNPVLTTLDVSMPGMDGFAVAQRLRQFSSTYIIMLTGQADEIDVIQGLQSGADDYLVKPFRPRELRMRIEAMLRRPRSMGPGADAAGAASPQVAPGAAPLVPQPSPTAPAPVIAPAPQPQVPQQVPEQQVPQQVPEQQVPQQVPEQQVPQQWPAPTAPAAPVDQPPPSPTVDAAGPGRAPTGSSGAALEWRGLQADPATRLATADGRGLDLTRTEFDLLVALLESGRRVRSKADLVLTLRGESYVTTYYVTDADKRAVEVHVANLRRKIGDSSGTPRWIETVRGVGYRLAQD